ncbi:MAG: hypothetical protein ACM3WV_10860 [Bacillota bacterium]
MKFWQSRINWFLLDVYLILFGLIFSWSAGNLNLPAISQSGRLGRLLDSALKLQEKGDFQQALSAYFSACPMVSAPPARADGWQKLGFPVIQTAVCRVGTRDFFLLAMADGGYGALGGYFPGVSKEPLFILTPDQCPVGWYGEISKAGNLCGAGRTEVAWGLVGGAGLYYYQPVISRWNGKSFQKIWGTENACFYGKLRWISPGLFILEESLSGGGIFRETVLGRHIKTETLYRWSGRAWRKIRTGPVKDAYFVLNGFLNHVRRGEASRARALMEKSFSLRIGARKYGGEKALQFLRVWSPRTVFEEVPFSIPTAGDFIADFYFSAADGKRKVVYGVAFTPDFPPRLAQMVEIKSAGR